MKGVMRYWKAYFVVTIINVILVQKFVLSSHHVVIGYLAGLSIYRPIVLFFFLICLGHPLTQSCDPPSCLRFRGIPSSCQDQHIHLRETRIES